MTAMIVHGEVLESLRSIPVEGVFQCCVTSPPYYGLRDYGHDNQIGLERTPEEYVARLVEVFREVRRLLRDDGTLWLNLGDSYARTGGTDRRAPRTAAVGSTQNTLAQMGDRTSRAGAIGLKHKDLVGIPWRVAFALQADGWYVRQDIIWHKPNPMPESVRDRCTRAHEYVFLLTKSERYYYDAEAVCEPSAEPGRVRQDRFGGATGHTVRHGQQSVFNGSQTRNLRSVWPISTKPFRGAHFAVMPDRLAELCILAGTSATGRCPVCDSPWVRRVSRTRVPTRTGTDTKATHDSLTQGNRDPLRHVTKVETLGWEPGCRGCGDHKPVPCSVLDPFAGSGTTLAVSERLGRDSVGIEINPDYVSLAKERIGLWAESTRSATT